MMASWSLTSKATIWLGELVGGRAGGGDDELDGPVGGGHCGLPWSDVWASVEVVLGDVLDHAVGHEVPDRLAAPVALAAVGRADRQRGDLHHRHTVGRDGSQRGEVHGVAGPRAADEVGQLEQLLGVAPGEDLGQRVGAGDEVELDVRHRRLAGHAGCRWCTSARRGRCRPARPRTSGWRPSRSPSSGSGARAGTTSRSDFCHGSPVGTNTTSSRSNHACTSEAATRWPWWMGSKVPPITPTRRRRRRGRRDVEAERVSCALVRRRRRSAHPARPAGSAACRPPTTQWLTPPQVSELLGSGQQQRRHGGHSTGRPAPATQRT